MVQLVTRHLGLGALTVLIFMLTVTAVGQDNVIQNRIDSISHILEHDSEQESVAHLLELADLVVDQNYAQAQQYVQQALRLSLKFNMRVEEYQCYLLMSDINMNYSLNYPTALEHQIKALDIAIELDDPTKEVIILRQIAYNHYAQQHLEKSRKYITRAVKIARDHRIVDQLATLYAYLAQTYEDQGDHDIAMIHYGRIMKMIQDGEKVTSASAIIMLGLYPWMDGQLDSAITGYKQALHHYQSTNNVRWEAYTYSQLAEVELQRGNPQPALTWAMKGAHMADSLKLMKESSDNHYILSVIYERLDITSLALKHYKIRTQIHDSIHNEMNAQKMLALQKSLDTKLREADIARLESENDLLEKKSELKQARIEQSRTANSLLVASVILCLLVVTFITISIRRKSKEQLRLQSIVESRTTELKTALFDSEQKHDQALAYHSMLLSSQINPHFISNSLNSIQYYVLDQAVEPALNFVARFSQLLRSVMFNSMNTLISLEKEKEFLELYLQLEQERLGGKLSYEVSIDSEIQPNSWMIPPMLIQPFVEDIVMHSIRNSKEDGFVRISFQRTASGMECQVIDNGVGLETMKSKRILTAGSDEESITMQKAYKRIEILNELGNGGYSIHRTNRLDEGSTKGSILTIIFPEASA